MKSRELAYQITPFKPSHVLARAGSAGGTPWIKGQLAGGLLARLTPRVHPSPLALLGLFVRKITVDSRAPRIPSRAIGPVGAKLCWTTHPAVMRRQGDIIPSSVCWRRPPSQPCAVPVSLVSTSI